MLPGDGFRLFMLWTGVVSTLALLVGGADFTGQVHNALRSPVLRRTGLPDKKSGFGCFAEPECVEFIRNLCPLPQFKTDGV